MRNIADIAILAMKDAGADKAQVTITRAEKTELNIDTGDLKLMRTTFSNSAALTAIKDNKKGTSQLGSWDLEAIKAAAREAVEMAEAGQADEAYDIALLEDGANEFKAGLDKPEDCLLPLTAAMCERVKKDFPKISYSYFVAFNKTEKLVANTNGVSLSVTDGRYEISSEFSAKDGEVVTSFNYVSGELSTLPDDLIEALDFRAHLEQSVKELGAKPAGEKFTGEVIFQPECLFELLEQYAGCFLTDAALIGGTSMLKDKFGEKVTSENVIIRAIPLNNDICRTFVTNDGFRTENMDIIKNGILENFLLTQYGANKTSKKRAKGNIPNIEMDAGDKTLDEIISETKRGLLIGGHISGGSPSENGTFSGVAKNSFLIEDGKITRPVQETMISGNVLDIFSNVTAISKERRNNGAAILPWVKSGGITVS
ncbi:MAG: TldD/PmbA family protein [Oscillospiraceae bacterium]|nr:TldD/PmbA family protein [Oscillospiraceae bacterium]